MEPRRSTSAAAIPDGEGPVILSKVWRDDGWPLHPTRLERVRGHPASFEPAARKRRHSAGLPCVRVPPCPLVQTHLHHSHRGPSAHVYVGLLNIRHHVPHGRSRRGFGASGKAEGLVLTHGLVEAGGDDTFACRPQVVTLW